MIEIDNVWSNWRLCSAKYMIYYLFNVYAESTLSTYRKGLCSFFLVLKFTPEDFVCRKKSCEYFRVLFSSVYSTWHFSSAEDKNILFCPQLRTQKMYGKQTLLSKPSTMAYLTMVVLLSWQLLTQYYTN